MISYDEALTVAFRTATSVPRRAVSVPLLEARGRVLAREIVSDIDMPPFNRAAMDGYAVRAEDIVSAPSELDVTDTVSAGTMPTVNVGPGQAARIMTGAPVPSGADSVVGVEDTECRNERVTVKVSLPVGKNIAPQGEDVRKGDVVAVADTLIRTAMLGLLGAAGAASVDVYRHPDVAVLTTGTELVDISQRPAPGQIRNTNILTLRALLADTGIKCRELGGVPDDIEKLRKAVRKGLGSDVLMVSGGVSMGDYDFVPRVFEEEGVTKIFHKVAMRPGKPLFLGRKGDKLVFGIPGNPVSTFVSFEMLVKPVLLTLSGDSRHRPSFIKATFTGGRARGSSREQMLPGILSAGDGLPHAKTTEWHGSGDMRGLSQANCFIRVPGGTNPPADGDIVEVHPFGAFR